MIGFVIDCLQFAMILYLLYCIQENRDEIDRLR